MITNKAKRFTCNDSDNFFICKIDGFPSEVAFSYEADLININGSVFIDELTILEYAICRTGERSWKYVDLSSTDCLLSSFLIDQKLAQHLVEFYHSPEGIEKLINKWIEE